MVQSLWPPQILQLSLGDGYPFGSATEARCFWDDAMRKPGATEEARTVGHDHPVAVRKEGTLACSRLQNGWNMHVG